MRRLEKRIGRRHTLIMAQPIDVDLPHTLGKEEAKRRLASNIHKLTDFIPGGTARATSRWEGDTMKLSVAAMGESIEADLTVFDNTVHCHFTLPGMLGMFAQPIAAMLQSKGGEILLEDHRG